MTRPTTQPAPPKTPRATPTPVVILVDEPGYRALLTDVKSTLATAITAAEIGAFPGPAWRQRAKDLIAIIDHVTA